MPKKILLIITLMFGGLQNSVAQFGLGHEVGVIAGPVAMQSDYGERRDMSTNAGNTGYGIGIVHYLNFAYNPECNCMRSYSYFSDHFKLRSELSYNKTQLKHFGKWVDESRTSVIAEQLRNMRGETAVTNIGMQLEYFPWSIRDFTVSRGSFAPFVSLGAQFSYFDPEATSTTGPLTIINTPEKYRDAFRNDSGTTWSIVSSVGTRYKLSELSDLMIDLRFQYYFSNWVDGLNPDPNRYPENKANDWLVWLNVGYIYYIN
ncbi:glutamate dehydrogenase [Flavobacterium sp. NST-5]|uniref:Glutamate dehydrogenase n=1 Tax=Flavobacterium ichthyis TaxID=2698827 RepID=A0ABW9Z9S7_9FLAO|nr:glutamate dehydrogenase [Flavobacterium ichthyis]NBL65454.1 glutamate dehydrogenase [Flavobacterium ichthyis]